MSGGAIVLGAGGAFALPFNTGGMFRGCIGADAQPRVAIWSVKSCARDNDVARFRPAAEVA